MVEVSRGVLCWGQDLSELEGLTHEGRGSANRSYKRDDAKKQASNAAMQQSSFDKLQNHHRVNNLYIVVIIVMNEYGW